MSSDRGITKIELLARIDNAWESLNDFLNGQDEATLTRVDPVSGWAVTDHLNHLAWWERGIGFLLSRRPRYEGMGISAEQWRDLTMDEINDIIYLQGRERTAAEAIAYFRSVHKEFLETIARLDDQDLMRPYSEYDEEGGFPDQPVIGWIIGNTYEHYQEHLGYILVSNSK